MYINPNKKIPMNMNNCNLVICNVVKNMSMWIKYIKYFLINNVLCSVKVCNLKKINICLTNEIERHDIRRKKCTLKILYRLYY